MALGSRELFSSTAGPTHLRYFAEDVQPVTFATNAGAPVLAPLTAVAFNRSSNQWVIFDADGSNNTDEVRGFVMPQKDPIQLSASDETTVNVIMKGKVHYDDIPLVSGSYNQAELLADIQTGALRDAGITVEGLPGTLN